MKLHNSGVIFDLVLPQKKLVFRANLSYLSKAWFLPIGDYIAQFAPSNVTSGINGKFVITQNFQGLKKIVKQ